jgi:hypothetical protein
MPFKGLFFISRKNDYRAELENKIASLERNLLEIKMAVTKIEENTPAHYSGKPADPPIIIEKINIEKIVVDKYELNNNFGQLGIKELKGKLNIGATYGSEFTPNIQDEDEDESDNESRRRSDQSQNSNGPKVNIKAKKED